MERVCDTSRSEAVLEGTRERLLEGARKGIARHGIRGMTVEHVVKSAGVSRRTFYGYYRDKDDIVAEVYAITVRELVAFMEEAVDGATEPVASLHAGIDAFLDVQQKGGRLIAELQAEAANPASPLWPDRIRAVQELVALFDTRVRAAANIRLDPLVYEMLLHGLEAIVIRLREGGPLAPDRRAEAAHLAKAMFMNVLVGAPYLPSAPD